MQIVGCVLVADTQCIVRFGLLARDGQDFLPPPHYPIRFREKPVSANIHAVAAIVDRLGNTAYLGICFEYDWRNVGAAQQFKRSGEARWAGAGNACGLFHVFETWART